MDWIALLDKLPTSLLRGIACFCGLGERWGAPVFAVAAVAYLCGWFG